LPLVAYNPKPVILTGAFCLKAYPKVQRPGAAKSRLVTAIPRLPAAAFNGCHELKGLAEWFGLELTPDGGGCQFVVLNRSRQFMKALRSPDVSISVVTLLSKSSTRPSSKNLDQNVPFFEAGLQEMNNLTLDLVINRFAKRA